MVTTVGLQNDFADALSELVELDFDAVEAYTTAINRLENNEYKERLETFKGDHQRHITELSAVLQQYQKTPPTSPSMGKQWLAKGKVVLGGLVGDHTILAAMRSNEVDTNTAYERLNGREDKWPEAVEPLRRGLEDERRHKAWLEMVLETVPV